MGIIRKEIRRGVARWIIDIRYRGKDGKRRRFRRDAQVQSRGAAEAEARRLLTQLAETGSLEVSSNERESEAPITVDEAIQHFLLVEMPKKKPSTQRGYLAILDSEIRPRFAERPIGDLNKDLFLRLIEEFPHMAVEIMRVLASRLERTTKALAQANIQAAAGPAPTAADA